MTEIASLLQRFWKLRRLMRLAVLAGLAAALLSLVRFTDEAPYVEMRDSERGVAETQLLVDLERSALTNADYDIGALSTRAELLVRLLDAAEGHDLIAEKAGIDRNELAIATFEQRAGAPPTPNPTLGQRSNDIADEVLGYRLEVMVREGLPLITLAAQAPDPADAGRLANAGAQAAIEYLSTLTSASAAAPAGSDASGELGRIRLEQLGDATGRSVTVGGGYGYAAIVGGLAFLGMAVLLLFLAGLRDELRARRALEPGEPQRAQPLR